MEIISIKINTLTYIFLHIGIEIQTELYKETKIQAEIRIKQK